MAKQHSLQLSSGLRYERAGLLFRVGLDLPEERTDGQGATVRIVAEDLNTGQRTVHERRLPSLSGLYGGLSTLDGPARDQGD